MKIGIYSYKDNVNGFMTPNFEVYDPAAVRGFAYAVNNPGLMNFKPEDYSLWKIAEFDSETGVVTPVEPTLIVHATEVLK